jgi:hypothetical protein
VGPVSERRCEAAAIPLGAKTAQARETARRELAHVCTRVPSGLAKIKSDAMGKRKKIYKSYFTLFEAFTGHPTASTFLKNDRTLENSPKWPISRVIMKTPLPCKKHRTTYSLHSYLSRNDGSAFQ